MRYRKDLGIKGATERNDTHRKEHQMAHPQTDACCTRMGWIEYLADADGFDLHISAHPDADLDGTFLAFDHDEQEMIKINGWLFTFDEVAA